MALFNKRGKIILAIISSLCIILSTVCGVITAKLVSSIHFGESILLSSLDAVNFSRDGVVNILLLGVDEGGMRSDTMMVASLSGKTGKLSILSIPRDTRVRIGNGYQKINSAIGIGAQEVKRGNLDEPEELSVQKVKDLTGLPIHYFASVDFEGFKAVIDVLGGVDYNVPFNMKYSDPAQNLYIDLKKGMQHLDGKAAHDFVRYRSGYADADLGRINAQQDFLKALIDQKVNPKYIAKAGDIFEVIGEYIRTNYTVKDLLVHLGTIGNLSAESVQMYQLPGSPQTIGGVSYYICDPDATDELVESVFSE